MRSQRLFFPLNILLLCIFPFACNPPLQTKCNEAVNGIATTTINTEGRSCQDDCECNNQNYEGKCIENKCAATERESCQTQGKKVDCKVKGSLCDVGIQICQDEGLLSLKLGDCKPITPIPEKGPALCSDGRDNDCDGKTDKGDPDCKDVCQPGDERACYTGPDDTRKEGECRDGIETCSNQGTWPNKCVGEKLPSIESCNQKDDNCDGKIDEGLKGCQPERCELGDTLPCFSAPTGCTPKQGSTNYQCIGPCKAGVQECNAQGVYDTTCKGEIKPQVEICNGKDDDCNGVIDDKPCKCTSGFTNCGGKCFNLKKESQHCGACEQSCSATEHCSSGLCCPTDLTNCRGTCVNLLTNKSNCGACGRRCGSQQDCISQKCKSR